MERAELFNKGLNDECLNIQWIELLAEAKQLIESSRREYSETI